MIISAQGGGNAALFSYLYANFKNIDESIYCRSSFRSR
jgi:hypothetical protein